MSEVKIQQSSMNRLLYREKTLHNIVWEVNDLREFQQFLPSFIEDGEETGMKIVYIHFSDQRLMPEGMVEEKHIALSHRFEAFTMTVYNLLVHSKRNVFYIFDSLSDLQTAWATDLMMQNFFMVITPLISDRGCRAFYPLIRSRHSAKAIDGILEEADAVLDVYSDFKDLYVRAMKLPGITDGGLDFNLPHVYRRKARFSPITDGYTEARFQKAISFSLHSMREENMDSWDRFFYNVQRDYENGADISEACGRIRDIMMSRDPHIRDLLEKHFKPEDYFFVREHMVGTGLIGGKACGMLTARKIIENRRPDIFDHMEPHNSFFIGSDVFYTYIVENGFWDLRVLQREPEGYFTVADEFADRLMHGKFSAKIEEEFIRLLEYYGPAPIIVRSSSILEDGFGNAFAGKYESVFCPGNGSLTERLAEFEDAIRVVYASTMSRSALDYRLRRGLGDRDEQMALLVMRVSGANYGKYYMPCVAGVGYSYSTYRFLDSLDPKAGMLRMVMGLGTCAVDRIEGSYPRLISLDKPMATSYKSQAEHHRYSQRNVQLIDTESGSLVQVPYTTAEKALPPKLKNLLLDHDVEAERRFRDRGQLRDIRFVTCSGFAGNRDMMSDMQGLMQAIQESYGQPVDIEFTINIMEDDSYVINLLQCRPLLVFEDRKRQLIPEDIPEEEIFIDCRHTSMGQSQEMPVDAIVYVDPIAYYNMPYNQKHEVAGAIGRINWYFQKKNKKLVLIVPGRVGTSSPELGVPTAFSDISEFSAIFEVAESRAGYNPELSYGSHIFQDLVENEILYMAIFEDDRTRAFRMDPVTGKENRLTMVDGELESLSSVMGLYLMEEGECVMYHDLYDEHLVCVIRDLADSNEAAKENQSGEDAATRENKKENQAEGDAADRQRKSGIQAGEDAADRTRNSIKTEERQKEATTANRQEVRS